MSLERVHVDHEFELLGFGKLVGIFDRLSKVGESFPESLETGIYLVAVTKRDYVLSGCVNLDSFKPISREHAWASHAIDSSRGNNVIARARRNGSATFGIEAFGYRLVFHPTHALQIGQVAVYLLARKAMGGFQIGSQNAYGDSSTGGFAPSAGGIHIPLKKEAEDYFTYFVVGAILGLRL